MVLPSHEDVDGTVGPTIGAAAPAAVAVAAALVEYGAPGALLARLLIIPAPPGGPGAREKVVETPLLTTVRLMFGNSD